MKHGHQKWNRSPQDEAAGCGNADSDETLERRNFVAETATVADDHREVRGALKKDKHNKNRRSSKSSSSSTTTSTLKTRDCRKKASTAKIKKSAGVGGLSSSDSAPSVTAISSAVAAATVASARNVSLRWGFELDDPGEEAARIDDYKERRRQRYVDAAAAAAAAKRCTELSRSNVFADGADTNIKLQIGSLTSPFIVGDVLRQLTTDGRLDPVPRHRQNWRQIDLCCV